MTVDQKERSPKRRTEDRRSSPTLSGENARQGRIVLNNWTKQAIFLAAFILVAVFAVIALIGAYI